MALTQKKKRFSLFGSPPRSPTLSPGIGASLFSGYFPSQDNLTEKRPQAIADDARKAVDALERLVTAADAYRDLMNKLSKASKVLSNALKDYGNCKGLENKHVMCMQTTSQFYDSHADVLSKLNKALQKDFDLLQRFWDKYSKKAIKDEKAHNSYVKDLDKQVKKIGKDYEKKSKKDPTISLDSHNNYLASMTTVGSEITRARVEYTDQVVKREKKTHSLIAQVICRLTEGHFASFNDSLKKCGPSIAKMKEWEPFAGEGMPLPQGLDDLLEDQSAAPRSDQESIDSEKVSDSIASISERQLAAMNYSPPESTLPEHTLPIIDENSDSNVSTKYVQMPTPKSIDPIATKPFSPPIIDTRKGSNTSTPEVTPSTYPVYPVSPSTVKPSDTKSASDLLSGFSIGIHADDHPFFRDEKVVEVNAAELYVENRVEKAILKPNITKTKAEENVDTKTPQKIVGNDNVGNNISVDNKPIQVKKYLTSETPSPIEGFTVSRKAVSDDSNSTVRSNDSTLHGDERNVSEDFEIEKPPDLNILKANVSKDEVVASPPITDDLKPPINKHPETETKDRKIEELIEEINSVEQDFRVVENKQPKVTEQKNVKQNISELKNDQSIIDKQNNTQQNKPLSKNDKETNVKDQDPINPEKELRTVPSISTDSLVESFPTELPIRSSPLQKIQQTFDDYLENDSDSDNLPHNRSPVQSPRPIKEEFRVINQYGRNLDNHREFMPMRKEDYRELYRHDLLRYEDDRRYNDQNRYLKRDVVRRDYDLDYGMQPYGDRGRYDEPIRDSSFDPRYRQRRDPDDGYGPSYYGQSRMQTAYSRDRSPPRHDPYAYRSYTDPDRPGSSVADIRDRFQSMNEERRPLSSPRDFPTSRSGRVSDLTSRFGGIRSESRNDASTLSRSVGDYRYNVGGNCRSQSSYRDERYIDEVCYGDASLHGRQCDCYDCRQLNISSLNNTRSTPPLRSYHDDPPRNLR